MANSNVKGMELIALVLMLIPVISLIGFILYLIFAKWSTLKLIVAILTIPFGFLAAIFLWLDAFGILSLGGKK